MLPLLSIFLLTVFAQDAAKTPGDRAVGLRLDFVERNVLNILQFGHYPQLYNSSFPKIEACGCYYSPTKLSFGTKIGLSCHRRYSDEQPPYDKENCGLICNDPHGVDIVMFCPHGWDSDCGRGCFPPDSFSNVDARADFWELTITSLMMYGHDYIAVAAEYLEACGCNGKIRPIRYGTGIGFDCIMAEDKEPKESCLASFNCADHAGRRVVTFCPAGHKPSCNGCEKVMEEGDDILNRLKWMTNVITGYARESLTLLGWEPTTQQIIDCGCSGGVEPVNYGQSIGYYCVITNADHITKQCGPNVLCKNRAGADILHFCPDGYVPSCQEGCEFPWTNEEKNEL